MNLQATVIVPNYNGRSLLPDCLTSLEKQTDVCFETIVVDDASTDDSVAYVRDRFPGVRIVERVRNGHFSAAVNCGIRLAAADTIVLLNSDTEAEPTWLKELLAALENAPEAGMATSKLLVFDKRNVLHSAGDGYSLTGVPSNRGVWEVDAGQYDGATSVFSACGGAAAYRKSMLQEVGLFDEEFIGYCEDVDLSFRAQLAGYRCVFAPRARVYHRISATGGGSRASFLCGRNFLNVIIKNMPEALLRRHWPRILRAQLSITLRSLRHFRDKATRAWLLGQIDALSHLPATLSKRRAIQASRRISIRELEAMLDA